VAKNHGLGKGLAALLKESEISEETISAETSPAQTESAPASAASEESASKAPSKKAAKSKLPAGMESDDDGQLWVNPSLLKPNPHQPRTEFDEEKLAELAESIREHGIIESIVVEDAGDGSFYIIAGERRTRAARIAGLDKVPVTLRKFSEQKKLEIALIENIQRDDLNDIEEAQAYYKLMELGGLTQEQVASRVGKNRATVANAIRLLKLPEDMQSALAKGSITAGHARALLSVKNKDDQRILFGKIIGSGMSVRQAEEAASAINEGAKAKKAGKDQPKIEVERDPDFANLEQQFRDVLGTKVVLKGSMERGTLNIDYFSRDDLDRLYNIITQK